MKSRAFPCLRMVILAAGFSTRLGRPKALTRIHGVTLLCRTLRVLEPLAKSRVVVIVPPRACRYRAGSRARSVHFISNPLRAAGLGSAVQLAVRRARYSAAVLLLPVDLVELKRRDVSRLISRWRGSRRKVVAHRVSAGAAVPLILPRRLYPSALGLAGDFGMQPALRRVPRSEVLLTTLRSAERDLDTPHDLTRARRRFHRTS